MPRSARIGWGVQQIDCFLSTAFPNEINELHRKIRSLRRFPTPL